jgi:LPXTG-motif cell wall-anchored protein
LAVEAVPEAGSLVMASLVAAGIGGVYLRRRKQTA